jgi:hypothetical protein
VVIWEACRAGAGSAQGAEFLVGWWMQLSQARLVPVSAGQSSSRSTQSWSLSGPDGQGSPRGGGLIIPYVAGAQHGLKDGGLGEIGILAGCGTGSGQHGTGIKTDMKTNETK